MDWELTCRVCLEGGDMVSLFDCDENNELLSEKYKFTTGIEVTENESLPTLICLTCVDRLMFAYQFKQQCVNSNDTLKECLLELTKSNSTSKSAAEGSETVTIKQENGEYMQYEVPVERQGGLRTVVTSAPPARRRGRPRKYPDQSGQIPASPYNRKTPRKNKEVMSLSALLASGGLAPKLEPNEADKDDAAEIAETAEYLDEGAVDADDDDYVPPAEENVKPQTPKAKSGKRKVGRPPKKAPDETGEDILLKETIMAYQEPLSEEAVRKPRQTAKPSAAKKYTYTKTHTCETCGSSFRSNASLQAHIRRHLGIKPFVCSVCNYACVLNMELRRHMMRHTGQRPYKCRICERRFGDFGSRQKHERLHLGERPYQCTLCGKSFTYSYVLSNHMLTHTGEKKFSCEPCNKKFTKAHHLKYHNKVHHKEVYMQQQMELEAKRLREQIKITDLSSVFTGQLLAGNVQLIQTEGEESGAVLQVLESGGEGQGEVEQAVHEIQRHDEFQYRQDEMQIQIDSQIESMNEEEDEGEMIVGDM